MLDLDANPTSRGHRQTHGGVFSAISMLEGLKTLYIQSSRTQCSGAPTIRGAMDLGACKHLHHVAVQGIKLDGMLVLPPGCLLEALSERAYLSDYAGFVAQLVTGLTLRPASSKKLSKTPSRVDSLAPYKWNWLLADVPYMQNLTQLKVVLNREEVDECYREKGALHVYIHRSRMPSLKSVELDLPCNLVVMIYSGFELTRLVLIAAGTLQLHLPEPFPSSVSTTVKQMYLWSSAAISPRYMLGLKALDAVMPPESMRLLQYITKERNGWIAQLPTGFHPGNVQECCCNACLDCLARDGVPILCSHAWTHDAFDKHLRPH